jgi:hypothetical protein
MLELLVEVRERLPLREVQAERSRLLDARRRRREAVWLARVADGKELGLAAPGRGPALISASVATAVQTELLPAAAALDSERPAVEGVAFAEQIAREPWSPLYGQDARVAGGVVSCAVSAGGREVTAVRYPRRR